jgi:hypothetical protein
MISVTTGDDASEPLKISDQEILKKFTLRVSIFELFLQVVEL